MKDAPTQDKPSTEKPRTYIIAEMSANHLQDYDRAVEIIHAAKASGADAIKLQTYTPDTITLDCNNEYFQVGKGTIWEGTSLYQLYTKAFTPWEWQPALKKTAEDIGLDCFSTPFDATAVDFLEEIGVSTYKVASFEVVDIPLLLKIGSTGKPVIMSTGMATFTEIEEAVAALNESGCPDITLLKCTSAYPALPEDANLLAIPDMKQRFGCRVGLSDHTPGIVVPVAAVALGATVVEKHLTLLRSDGGPDSAFSLEPAEFEEMVNAVHTTEKALGKTHYGGSEIEEKSKVFRRSIFAVEDIREGESFTTDNIRSIRPAYGLPPKYLSDIINKKAACNIARGTPLTNTLIQGGLETSAH